MMSHDLLHEKYWDSRSNHDVEHDDVVRSSLDNAVLEPHIRAGYSSEKTNCDYQEDTFVDCVDDWKEQASNEVPRMRDKLLF
jgi:hypothetical protein